MVNFIELKNKFDTYVTLCNVGASIYDIKTIDKNKNIESIIYTTKDKKDFLTEGSYLGKTIGRTGGRISNSKFKLNGIEYTIPSNDPNGLHGGLGGISYKEFKFNQNETDEYYEVIFNYLSLGVDSNYPGDLNINVIYRLYKNINKLTVKYDCISNLDTLANISNHSYFNLSGNAKRDILGHELWINASKMEKIENLIPKDIVKCEKIYSFKNKHIIGDYLKESEIINNTNGYDFPYIFDENDILKDNAKLKDSISKRTLTIRTTYPTVVLYTCNYVGDEIMNNEKKAMPYYAACLECMYHPNTINSPFLKDKKDVLRASELYNETVEYYFEVEND